MLLTKPLCYAGIYPIDASEFDLLDKAMGKLTLNDASVSCVKESSNALGLGFRCGFLGLLHMDVFRQRLEQEFNADIIITSPTVPYKARLLSSPEEDVLVSNPSLFPEPNDVISFSEPVILATIITPSEYLGAIMDLCNEKRGSQVELEFLDHDQALARYIVPLSEVVVDFYDRLKSATKGYASLEYVSSGYQDANVVKLTFQLNGSAVDALTTVVHKSNAERVGRDIAGRLKDVLSRQQFDVAIQATVGSKVIARETVKAVRKNVLVKSGKMVGGGDVSRKKKLLEKQKEGKKRMKRVGNVDLSQEAFLSVIGSRK
jgi:elongation factor 4